MSEKLTKAEKRVLDYIERTLKEGEEEAQKEGFDV